MRINSISSNYYQNNITSFKSTFPVAYWVKDRGRWTPVTSIGVVKELQRKVVTILNHELSTMKNSKIMNEAEQTLRSHVSSKDVDYRLASESPKYKRDERKKKDRRITPVRSYLNRVTQTKGPYDPISYLITGYKDIAEFNEAYSENIGNTIGGAIETHETAVKNYHNNGLTFVEDPKKVLRDAKTGIEQVLHVAFEIQRDVFGKIIRNKQGKIQYRFIKGEFKPASGPENPLEKFNK